MQRPGGVIRTFICMKCISELKILIRNVPESWVGPKWLHVGQNISWIKNKDEIWSQLQRIIKCKHAHTSASVWSSISRPGMLPFETKQIQLADCPQDPASKVWKGYQWLGGIGPLNPFESRDLQFIGRTSSVYSDDYETGKLRCIAWAENKNPSTFKKKGLQQVG